MEKHPFVHFFLHYLVIVFDGRMYKCIPHDDDMEVTRRNSFLYSHNQQTIYFVEILEIGLLEKYIDRIEREISDLKQALAQIT
jgi:hypothetical protein